MEPLDVWKLGGDPTRLFGGYMKMQWIWGGPKRAAAAMLLALGLGGLAVAGADHLLNPPATFKFASADAPASRISFAPVVKKVLPLSLIHISEPTRLGMISYAVFCLKKKKEILSTSYPTY